MSAALRSALRLIRVQQVKHKTKLKYYPYEFREVKDDCVTYVYLDIRDSDTREIISSRIVMTYVNPSCTPRPPQPDGDGTFLGLFPVGSNPFFYFTKELGRTEISDIGTQLTELMEVRIDSAVFQEYPGNSLNGENYALGYHETVDGRDIRDIFFIEGKKSQWYQENELPNLPRRTDNYTVNGINKVYTVAPLYKEYEYNGQIYQLLRGYYPVDEYGNWIDPNNEDKRIYRNDNGVITGIFLPDDPYLPVFKIVYPSPQVGLKVTATGSWSGSLKSANPYYYAGTTIFEDQFYPGDPIYPSGSARFSASKTWDLYTRPGGIYRDNVQPTTKGWFLRFGSALSVDGSAISLGQFTDPATGDPIYITPSSPEYLESKIEIYCLFSYPNTEIENQNQNQNFISDVKYRNFTSYRYGEDATDYLRPPFLPEWWPQDPPRKEDFFIREWIHYDFYNEIPPMNQNCCADLKKLLKIVIKNQEEKIIPNQEEKIIPTLGDFPANVPDLFTKQNPSIVKKESLLDLILWQTKQLDALIGAYPLEIELEDADLTQGGKQTKKITIPNMAEALAEILGLLLVAQTNNDLNLVATFNAMTEAGMAKKAATVASEVSLANAEYLGYQLSQKKRKLPLTFTPGKEKTEDVLKDSELEYTGYENTDKFDLNDYLRRILEAAAIIKAQNFVRVRDEGDIDKRLNTNIDSLTDKFNENADEDFDTFTEKAEMGFIGVTGITDNQNPWGKPINERPRVREIGQDKTGED